ncbi:mitochondrial fission process protein 1-like [Rhopilema esculentum]|uniref:mitochondrial fission process protein 1-like n=1 Tax=Rhopilema esculentum TaxID=499914 RepID=UPI0031D64C25|eukprot:gene15856-7181_t
MGRLNMIMMIDSREHDVMIKSQQSQHEKATWQCNMAEALEATTKDVDLFRDTPVRLLGYANEVGEAFRSLVPKSLVVASYGVASLYAVSDASDKAYKSYQKNGTNEKLRNQKSVEVFLEAAVWQALASVIIPGFTINRICRLSSLSLSRIASSLSLSTRNKITTSIGMASIPLIIKPIDRLVDSVMEQAVPITRSILLTESVIEESIHAAVEGRTETFGEWRQ